MKHLVHLKEYAQKITGKNASYMFLRRKDQSGYTIIELVVVIMVMLIVGGIIVGILYSSIRGTTKARVNNNISQNGSYAITVMTNFLANAKDLIQVSDPFGNTYDTCVSDGINPVDGVSVTIQNYDGGVTTFACQNGYISSNSASLIHTEDVEMITDTCRMRCIQDSFYAPPRIDISFELQNKNAQDPTTSGRSLFETSVTLRNYGL